MGTGRSFTIFLNAGQRNKQMPTIQEISGQSKTNRLGYEHALDCLANYIVKAAIRLRLTPLTLTIFWIIGQFLTTFLFLIPRYESTVLAIILFQVMFLVDLSDGKLARFYHSTCPRSPTNENKKPLFPKYLDRLGHFLNDSLLFVCLGIGTAWRLENQSYLYLGLAAAFFFLCNKAISVNPAWYKSSEEQANVHEAFHHSHPRAERKKIIQFLFDFLRVEHLFNFLFLGIVLNQLGIVLVTYVLVFFLELMRKMVAQGRYLRSVDADRAK